MWSVPLPNSSSTGISDQVTPGDIASLIQSDELAFRALHALRIKGHSVELAWTLRRPAPDVCRDGFLELILGRIYADPNRLARLFWDAMPLAYDIEALLEDKTLFDRAPTRFDPERADGAFLARLPATIWAMLKSARTAGRTGPEW